jgi:DNA polymerase
LYALLRSVRALVEQQQATGVHGFGAALKAAGTAAAAPAVAAPAPAPGVPRPARPTSAPPVPAGAPTVHATVSTGNLFAERGLLQTDSLAALRAYIGDCQRCKLAGGRTHLVFGVGNANAALMFVGEGPGHDEDVKGEPFVGRAGQLLTEIITKGMKLRREDVYIANVIKCRPPNNRNPEPDEIASCMPFLARQIELVKPRVIVALGTFAAQTLLGVKTPITRMRGNWHDYRGVKVMPTLHPAYLLRTPGDKKLVWEDIKQVMAELGMGR